MLLGHELRKHREQRGISREDAGNRIRASASKISRMELGRVGFKIRDIEDLLKMYGITDRQVVKEFVDVARESNKSGWWKEYGDSLHKWFVRYVGFEEAADHIRIYESQFVPGLLQTEEYAREIISGGVETDMVTEQRIEARLRRQQRLETDQDMRMWVILDESAVRRPIGGKPRGKEIMCGQIRRLIEFCRDYTNITLQIVPFEVGAHAAEAGSFTLLRYSEFELADLLYLEQLTDGEIVDRRNVVEAYTKAMTRLSVVAYTPDETLEMLHQVLEDFEKA
ncbi:MULTISPECIES: helix-turn-helix domain-containing protein [unclassified Nocardiopsis]|uniref:helix-turn-helix domain-containing protein n=1 Tax=unclassified Nocardiopsis TaxID=2649073 RepID=UPI00048FFBD0|nr:helix-turn-helix transcriptional regulator [Nocardiopsis sp. CNT312]